AKVKGLLHTPVFFYALADIVLFKGFSEFQIFLVDGGELILTDDRGKVPRVAHLCIGGEQLVCKILVVFSCIPFSDTVLHQTGQRREDVDRRIDGLSVERTVKHDLSLRDISSQVRDRVSDIVVRHGKDRKLCHGAFHALHDAGALIDRRQLAVQIAREAFTAGDLSFGGGDLTHCLGERSHIRQDDKDMHVLLKGQIFGHCKRHLRGDQTLHDRIVRKVQEHCDMVRNAAFLKGVPEEIRNVVLYAHGGEHDGELLIGTFAQRRLLYDLCRE